MKNRSRVTVGGGEGGWGDIKKKNQCNHFCMEVNLATGSGNNPFSETVGTLGQDVKNGTKLLLLLSAHTKENERKT